MSEEINLSAPGTKIVIVDERTIRDKIYIVRGVKVMLDFELAEIYGYTTKAFNQQVRNNIRKFDDDFRFQLTTEEFQNLRSKILTSSWGGTRYLPWAFTEPGIYMLMTVLKGDLATQQSKALIRTFQAMKDYIVENQSLISQHDYLRLSMQVSDTQQTVHAIQAQLMEHEDKLNSVFVQMNDTVKRSEISPFLLDFGREDRPKEFLLLNGQPAKADETYIDIYSQARSTVYIIDNYISIKTLRLLQGIRSGVQVTIFSDNLGNQLHASDYADFHVEFPNIPITFRQTCKSTHDRFIVLDYGTKNERIFHCGASSKDAGVKLMTAISEMVEGDFKSFFKTVIQRLIANPILVLR